MVDPALIIDGLVARGVPLPAAIGMAGNLAVESNFNPGINEIAPVVPGSRGGYGLAQWTGPRRVQYEQFAQDRGVPLDDLNAQLDFLTWELQNTERRAADRIFAAQTPEEAARLTSDLFLRPGIPHMDRRLEETQRLAGTYQPGQTNALASSQWTGGTPFNPNAPPPNALAAQQQAQLRQREGYRNALMESLQAPIYANQLQGVR